MSNTVTNAAEYRDRRRPMVEFPSGAIFQLRRPGPEIGFKFGRLPQSLVALMQSAETGETAEESGKRFLQEMSDADFQAFMLYARDMVQAVFYRPRIVVGATGEDELDPDDLEGADFWFAFNWGQAGGPDIPVRIGEGETTVSAVETFRADSGIRSDGEGSQDVPDEALEPVGAPV